MDALRRLEETPALRRGRSPIRSPVGSRNRSAALPRRRSPVYSIAGSSRSRSESGDRRSRYNNRRQERDYNRIREFRPFNEICDDELYEGMEGVPERALRAALKGNYFTIDDFLENIVLDEAENEVERGSYYRPRRSRRKVENVKAWLEAWGRYERYMVRAHGEAIYFHLARYRAKILDMDKKYEWCCVYVYDMRHRAALSGKSVAFDVLDLELHAQIYDPGSVRAGAPRCYNCYSYDHLARNCPLKETPFRDAPASSWGGWHGQSSRQRSRQRYCLNFNESYGCSFRWCQKIHACTGCGGE